MSLRFLVVALCAVALAGAEDAYTLEENVLVLTKDNFASALAEYPNLLVEFCEYIALSVASRCGTACSRFVSRRRSMVRTLQEPGSGVRQSRHPTGDRRAGDQAGKGRRYPRAGTRGAAWRQRVSHAQVLQERKFHGIQR